MRRKSANILAFMILAVMLCLTGCKGVKDISVTSVEVESISMKGMKGLDVFLKVGVDNPAKQVRISEIEGSLKHSGKVIGNLAMDPFILGGKTADIYTLKATVTLAQGAGLKDLIALTDKNGLNRCTVDFSAKAKYGKNAPVQIKRKEIPLKELLDKL